MSKFLCMVPFALLSFAAYAGEYPDYTEPSLFRCPTQPKSLTALDRCAKDNTDAANKNNAPLPVYSKDAANYFYQGLKDMSGRQVDFAAKNPALTNDDALFRRHLGEWLYFTQANSIDDNVPPTNYAEVESDEFAHVNIFPQADGSFLVFYWDYNGAANSAYQAVRLNAQGAKLLSSEAYDETSKKAGPAAIASFNEFSFNPNTGVLVTVNHDGYNSAYQSTYKLNGDFFRLAREEHLVLQENGNQKSTTLYKAR